MTRRIQTTPTTRNPVIDASRSYFQPARLRRGLLVVVLGILGSTLAACASTMDQLALEQAVYEREDARLQLMADFDARVNRCRLRGGYMVLPMGAGGRVDRSTMEKAYCDQNWQGLKGVLYD